MRKSDWPFFIWLEFEISCKVVEIVLFFPPTVSEGQSTAFWFFFVAIWNLLPLTFLSSAGHLEFIHAITPSSFSCCITVCQWPLFSALPFLCSLSSAGKLREKKPHRNTKSPPCWGSRHEVLCNYSHCSNSQTHTSKWAVNCTDTLGFSLHMTWSHSEDGGKCTQFSSSLYFGLISCVLGRIPSREDEAQYCKGTLKSKKIAFYLSSNTIEYYRNTLRVSWHGLLWTQSVLNFLQKEVLWEKT